MKPKPSIGALERRRTVKLKQLAQAGPLLQGSLSAIRVTCGNPNCKCVRGEKHLSHILCKKVRGKSTSIYVPVDMVETVSKWVEENRRIKKLLKEVSDLNEKIIRAHVSTRRAKERNRAVAEKVRVKNRP